MPTHVTVWNEYRQERTNEAVQEIYPDGIHAVIADGLRERGAEVQTATLDEPEHGLTEDVLEWTDVLVWWGHIAHDEVADEVVERVERRVLDGMGLIVLHSGIYAKIFQSLMGTSCQLTWRNEGETERLWVVDPGHPIVDGIEEYVEIPSAATYGEPFDVPAPDELVFISWFEGGEVFRSGCCYRRGKGRVFYFRPGDEDHPIYHHDGVMDVLSNATEWARNDASATVSYGNAPTPPNERDR